MNGLWKVVFLVVVGSISCVATRSSQHNLSAVFTLDKYIDSLEETKAKLYGATVSDEQFEQIIANQRQKVEIEKKLLNVEYAYERRLFELQKEQVLLEKLYAKTSVQSFALVKSELTKGNLNAAKDILSGLEERESLDFDISADVYHILGRIAEYQFDFLAAELHYVEAADSSADNYEYQLSAARMINLLSTDAQRFSEAHEYSQRALSILKSKTYEDARTFGKVYTQLGYSMYGQGFYYKSIEFYGKAVPLLLKVLSPEDPEVAKLYQMLADSWGALGGYVYHIEQSKAEHLAKTAIDYYSLALDIWKKNQKSKYPHAAIIRTRMADILLLQNQYYEASEFYSEVLTLWLRHLDIELDPQRHSDDLFGDHFVRHKMLKHYQPKLSSTYISHPFAFELKLFLANYWHTLAEDDMSLPLDERPALDSDYDSYSYASKLYEELLQRSVDDIKGTYYRLFGARLFAVRELFDRAADSYDLAASFIEEHSTKLPIAGLFFATGNAWHKQEQSVQKEMTLSNEMNRQYCDNCAEYAYCEERCNEQDNFSCEECDVYENIDEFLCGECKTNYAIASGCYDPIQL